MVIFLFLFKFITSQNHERVHHNFQDQSIVNELHTILFNTIVFQLFQKSLDSTYTLSVVVSMIEVTEFTFSSTKSLNFFHVLSEVSAIPTNTFHEVILSLSSNSKVVTSTTIISQSDGLFNQLYEIVHLAFIQLLSLGSIKAAFIKDVLTQGITIFQAGDIISNLFFDINVLFAVSYLSALMLILFVFVDLEL
jgi:hypothetical protein